MTYYDIFNGRYDQSMQLIADRRERLGVRVAEGVPVDYADRLELPTKPEKEEPKLPLTWVKVVGPSRGS